MINNYINDINPIKLYKQPSNSTALVTEGGINNFKLLLPCKLPIGYLIKYRGKSNVSVPLSRKTKYNFSNGNLSYKYEFRIYPNIFPINSLSYNKNQSQVNNVFNNGQCSLSAIISYF